MIDVRTLANQTIQQVNQNINVDWVRNYGYATDDAGKRVPVTVSQSVKAQVQGLSAGDIRFIDGLNIQGVLRSVHLYGNVQGVVRADQKGGDILKFPQVPDGSILEWRIVQVMETWPTWCRVIVCLQSPEPVEFMPLFIGSKLQGNGLLLNSSVLGVV